MIQDSPLTSAVAQLVLCSTLRVKKMAKITNAGECFWCIITMFIKYISTFLFLRTHRILVLYGHDEDSSYSDDESEKIACGYLVPEGEEDDYCDNHSWSRRN